MYGIGVNELPAEGTSWLGLLFALAEIQNFICCLIIENELLSIPRQCTISLLVSIAFECWKVKERILRIGNWNGHSNG